MQINVTVQDANNIVCDVTPPQPQIIVIDRGVEGNGIVSIVPVTISTFQYLRITYTNGTVQDVGPLTSTAYTATAPVTIVGNTISLATVPIASGGTDATTAAGAIQNLLPSYTGNGNKRLGLNSGATALEWVSDGGGTVTSVAASGGTTGLTFTGSPITSSGTLTLGGTLAVASGGTGVTTSTGTGSVVLSTSPTLVTPILGTPTSGNFSTGTFTWPTFNQNTSGTAAGLSATLAITSGGTGQTTANAAFNALAPSQTGNSGKYLTTDGTNTSWATNPLGTVTSVGGTGTVSGISLSGTVTTSGNLTLGGALDLSAYNGVGSFTTLAASGAVTLSGGTANGVAYLNGSKVLTSGSALTFDGTTLTNTGGITTNASFLATAGGNTGRMIAAAGGVYLGSTTAADLIFQYNQNEQMRLTSTGLGIGTSSPSSKLHLYTAASATTLTIDSGTSGTAIAYSLAGVAKYTAEYVSGSNFYAIGRSGVAYDFVLSSGNVGIGTSSIPTVGSTTVLAVGNASGGTHAITQSGSIVYRTSASTSGVDFYNPNASPLQFYTGGTSRLIIDSSGNLLVGGTSTVLSSKFLSKFNGASNNGAVLDETANTSSTTFLAFSNAGTAIGSVARVGATSAVVYNTTSDYRLKTVAGTVIGQGSRIDALKPIDYQWKEGGQQARGFLAHEFQAVYPNSVTGSKDAVDAEGKPVYQAMQAGSAEVIADLVAEIQSLRKRLADAGIA